MKNKLANMGAAAKRNLNNLALSFSRRARQNPNSLNAQTRDERETSSLMNYFEDKPDQNADEIITFEQVCHHHHLDHFHNHDDVFAKQTTLVSFRLRNPAASVLFVISIYNRSYFSQQSIHSLNISLFSFRKTPLLYNDSQRNPAAPVLPRGAPRHALEADPVAPGSAMFRKAR